MAVCIDQDIALAEEVRCAIYLIEFGLIALNRLENVEHLPIFLLSNGFERLLKIILCLDHLEQYSKFPNTSNFNKTHDVKKLLEQVVAIAKNWKYTGKCKSTKADMDLLENDRKLKRLVKILADYGNAGRYYNIDTIVGKKRIGSDPIQLFDSYRTGISNRMPNSRKKAAVGTPEEKLQECVCYANRQITKSLQRFARALCRMFIWGKLGQRGQNLSQIVGDFLDIQDVKLEQLKFPWLSIPERS